MANLRRAAVGPDPQPRFRRAEREGLAPRGSEIADVVNRIPYDGASRTSANKRANPRLTSDVNPLR